MLKLYDYLMMYGRDLSRYDNIKSERFHLGDKLKQAIRYEVTNVGAYYWQSAQIYWDVADPLHFPCLAPPHPVMWLEYVMPLSATVDKGVIDTTGKLGGALIGILIIAKRRESLEDPAFSKFDHSVAWVLDGHIFLADRISQRHPRKYIINPIGLYIGVKANGELGYTKKGVLAYSIGIPHEFAETYIEKPAIDQLSQVSKPFLLTLCFLACKNIIEVDYVPKPPKLKKGRKGSAKTPPKPASYRVLDIWPLRDVLRVKHKPAGTSPPSPEQTVPIVRGHFRNYTESGKLFGKYTGRFWIPQHIRGVGEDPTNWERKIRL